MRLLIDEKREIFTEPYYFKLFKLHESYLLLISNERDMGIGSVYMSLPSTIQGLPPSSANYGLFGMGRDLLGKVISEQCSSFLKAPTLLLLFLKTKLKDEKIVKPLVNALNDMLKTIENDLDK